MYERNQGASPVRLLKDRLAAEGLAFLDATDPVLGALAGRDICEIFSQQYTLTQCGGHYNEVGNEIIAEIIERDLARLRLDSR